MMYEQYKKCPSLWNFSFPSHWDIFPLYAVAKEKSVSNCNNLQLLSVYLDAGVIPFSAKTEKRTNVTSQDLSNYQRVDVGDFVLNNQQAWRGSVGISFHTGIVSPAYIVLSMNEMLNSKYANYLVRSHLMVDQYLINSNSVGSIQRNIHWKELKRVLLPIPPHAEQDQIVRFLDWKVSVINRLIGIKQRQIERLEEMRKAIIHKAVTKGLQDDVPMKDSGIDWIGEIPAHWIITNIKRKCKQVGSGTTPQTNDENYYNGNINWIQSGDLYNRDFINKTKKQLTQEAIKDYTVLKIYNAPFIVLAMYGASVGNVSISNVNSCVNQACCVLIPQEDISIFFMYYWLKFCKDDFISQSVGGGQPNISQAKIKDEIFAFPPRLEQEKIHKYIVEKNSVLDKTIDVKKHQITCLQELKTRLIIDTVTGKIDVRNIEIPEYEFVGEESQAEEEFDAEGSDNGE